VVLAPPFVTAAVNITDWPGEMLVPGLAVTEMEAGIG